VKVGLGWERISLPFTFNRAELVCGGWACNKLGGDFSGRNFKRLMWLGFQANRI
jgi:hypothetical protein